jgi:hypothetical protein
MKDTS